MGYAGQAGVHGQVTILEYKRHRAYVRENVRMDTFIICSCERLGVVAGMRIRPTQQAASEALFLEKWTIKDWKKETMWYAVLP